MAITLEWPTGFLPNSPQIAEYAVEQDTGVIRTPMEDGQARQRRRFEGPPSKVDVSWKMTEEQMQFFKSWVANKAGFGAAWFQIDLNMGEGILQRESRIISKPKYQYRGPDIWQVNTQLEVRDPPSMSSEVLDVVILLGDVQAAQRMAALLGDGDLLQPAIDDWEIYFGLT